MTCADDFGEERPKSPSPGITDKPSVGKSEVAAGEFDQQSEYDDFLEYLNERFCGFTGS